MLRSYLQLLNAGGALLVVDSNQLRFPDSDSSPAKGQGLALGQGSTTTTTTSSSSSSSSTTGASGTPPPRLVTFPIDDRFLFLHELLDVRIRGAWVMGDG